MGNLLVSLGGTRNADGTITDATGTTYSIQDGAWRPVAATTGTTTTGTTTTGTTDGGKVGTTEMGNLLVSLGGTRNADGTITDATGTTYSVQDGAWRPVANTTPTGGTTVTGGTTTLTGGATTPTAYDTFADSLRGKELTAEDAAAIVASGYSLNDLASTLSTATAPIDPLELRNFVNFHTAGSTTTDDGLVGTTGMGNLLVSLGGTRNADGTITDATGTTYSVQDGAWRPVAAVQQLPVQQLPVQQLPVQQLPVQHLLPTTIS
jgi:hypothetical protein